MLPSSPSGSLFAHRPPAPLPFHEVRGASTRRTMVRKTIEQRVLTLEDQMGELRGIPTQMSDLRSQVSQLHADMRGEFSAIRGEMVEAIAALRTDMVAGDEETRRQMRVLHEE